MRAWIAGILAGVAIVGGCAQSDGDGERVDPIVTTGQVMDALNSAGLSPPNPRDNTDGNCAELTCSEWLTTDILTVVIWDSTDDAQRWVDQSVLPAVLIEPSTTVHFQEGGTTPAYDRAAYEAAIASLG